jgi:hypothetical protein
MYLYNENYLTSDKREPKEYCEWVERLSNKEEYIKTHTPEENTRLLRYIISEQRFYNYKTLEQRLRDKERMVKLVKLNKNTKKYRYEVLSFPGFCGNPQYFKYKIFACIVCFIRAVVTTEGRVIDTNTGEHILVI